MKKGVEIFMTCIILFLLTSCYTVLLEPEITVRQDEVTIEQGESVEFSAVALFSQDTLAFTIENTGNNTLTISNITLSGDSEFSSNLDISFPYSLDVEEPLLTFNITFTPLEQGEKNSVLMISSNAYNQDIYIINLTGNTTQGNSPVPGNSGLISFSDVDENSMFINWTKATDIETSQSGLEYKVVLSLTANINSVNNAETNGSVVQDWSGYSSPLPVIELLSNTDYYFNILVRDETGNMEAYTMALQKTAGSPRLYWSEGGSGNCIKSANLNGSDVQVVISGLNDPRDIAIDPEGTYIYWADYGTSKIQRANLSGTPVITDLYDSGFGVSGPVEIVIDTANSTIYWTNIGGHVIYCGYIHGSQTPTTVVSSVAGPTGLAVDFANHTIYWADYYSSGIWKGVLSDTLPITEMTELDSYSYVYGLAIDTYRGYVYWTINYATGAICRVPDSGGSSEQVVYSETGVMALFLYLNGDDNDSVYWADTGTNTIRKTNIIDFSTETVLTADSTPNGITIH